MAARMAQCLFRGRAPSKPVRQTGARPAVVEPRQFVFGARDFVAQALRVRARGLGASCKVDFALAVRVQRELAMLACRFEDALLVARGTQRTIGFLVRQTRAFN